MALILNIETSTSVCSVAISKGTELLVCVETAEENNHANKLTLFIEEALKSQGLKIADLDAVAVSSGPGSYTGLRIGYSTAKGLCYAAGKPFLKVNTLLALAYGTKASREDDEKTLYCPMIDARRMEVYSAVYDYNMNEIEAIQATILDEHSFSNFLSKNKIVFCGNGAFKVPQAIQSPHMMIENNACSARNMIYLSYEAFKNTIFEDIAYSTPLYVKTPFITKPRKRL